MTSRGTVDDTRRDDTAAPDARVFGLTRTGLWVLVVQCLLALSWTLYVLFLPGLLARAGIDKRWFVYVLIADQAIFAACDWGAGVYADRVARVWRRASRAITALTLVSSTALIAMPWLAGDGNAVWLLVSIFVWAACSSALRAPVFALLGRVREPGSAKNKRAGLVAMALVGISLAGAFGPYVASALKNVDSRLPLALSALSLAAAGLWALRAEASLPRLDANRDASPAALRTARHRSWSLAAIVLVGAVGTQLVTAILAAPMFQRFVGAGAVVWVAWFWAGFGLGVLPGARIAVRPHPFNGAALALAAATVAFVSGRASDSVVLLALALAVAGAGWGVFSTVVFTSAVSISSGRATVRGAGTASGMVFSALAVATLVRLACVAAGLTKAELLAFVPAIAWITASLLLVLAARTLWRSWPEPDAPIAPAQEALTAAASPRG